MLWLRKLARRWPLTSKRRHRKVVGWLVRRAGQALRARRDALQAARNELATERRLREKADDLVRRQQVALAALVEMAGGRERFLYEYMDPERRAAGGARDARLLVQEVDARMGHVRTAVYMTAPAVAADTFASQTLRTVDVPLYRFAVQIGLPPDAPPELAAGLVAERVRAAVLEQWAGQAVLTGGGR